MPEPLAPSPVNAAPRPRVAVIVPAYGVAHLIGEAVASLQAQTMADWECLVIDDGAPDDVAGAAAPFLTDPRIQFCATDNRGVSAARNRAVGQTGAPLLTLLDGDDRLHPEYLATMCDLLEGDPAIRLATCNARIFGAVARERTCVSAKQGSGDGQRGSLADVLDRSFNVYIGSTFRRDDFEAIGGFDESMAQAEDFDLWVRLMMLGGPAHYVDRVLGEYRVRPGSASGNGAHMLLGNIKVYEKVRAALAPGRPEIALVNRLIAENQAALAFEHAIDEVIDGNVLRGIANLRAIRGLVSGPLWKLTFAVWRAVPALARPMLRRRRNLHRRGAVETGFMAGLFHRPNSAR